MTNRDDDRRQTLAAALDWLRQGGNLSAFCRERGIGRSTLYDWISADPERQRAFVEARLAWADAIADDALEIADGATDETVSVDRLRVDTRLRLAQRSSTVRVALGGDPHGIPLQAQAVRPMPLGEMESALLCAAEHARNQAAEKGRLGDDARRDLLAYAQAIETMVGAAKVTAEE